MYNRNAVHQFKASTVLFLTSMMLLNFNRGAIAQKAQDLQFTASGIVNSKYYSNGSLTYDLTNEFTCCISNGNYSMVLPASNSNDKRAMSFECIFDGTNTYFTTKLSTNAVTTVSTIKNGQIFEQKLSKPLRPNNNAILQIVKGSIPPFENQAVTLLWLGLGSIASPGDVLATNQAPLTFLGKVYRDQHIKLKAASRVHESIPHFLEWQEDYHEGIIFSERNGDLQKTPLPGSLSLGYTNSIYNVEAWTNVMGMSFPEQAALKIFFPSKNETGVECGIACSFTLISVELESHDTQFRPVVAAKTTVNDRRLEDETGKAAPYYLSLDGGLLSPSQLTNDPHYMVSPHLENAQKSSIITIRRVFLAVFALLFITPFFLLFLRWKKPNKHQN